MKMSSHELFTGKMCAYFRQQIEKDSKSFSVNADWQQLLGKKVAHVWMEGFISKEPA